MLSVERAEMMQPNWVNLGKKILMQLKRNPM
jgi:hypothetical protein